MDEENNKNFIACLIDTSDWLAKAVKELRTAREKGAIFNDEEYESITDIITDMQSDVDLLADYMKPYMRFGKNAFAAIEEK